MDAHAYRLNARARIDRAMKEPMRILNVRQEKKARHYEVEGCSGQVYEVLLTSSQPQCSCPDFWRGYRCKHIYFCSIWDLGWDPEDFFGIETVRSGNASSSGVCCICLETVESSEAWTCSTCVQPLHQKCLKGWVEKKQKISCPSCRSVETASYTDRFGTKCRELFSDS